jgi:hypothetical protein
MEGGGRKQGIRWYHLCKLFWCLLTFYSTHSITCWVRISLDVYSRSLLILVVRTLLLPNRISSGTLFLRLLVWLLWWMMWLDCDPNWTSTRMNSRPYESVPLLLWNLPLLRRMESPCPLLLPLLWLPSWFRLLFLDNQLRCRSLIAPLL